MELRQIQYFIEVAKREHMTDASNDLHVAQSAISRQISNLESELGVDLFTREGRNVKLTPIGRIFLKHMKEAIKAIENAKREVKENLDPEQGTIRIGFPSSLANYTFPSVISAFRAEHPHVKLHLKQGAYQYLIEAVAKGEIDMALLSPVPKGLKHIREETLFLENFVALLPDSHPLANHPSIHLNQLENDSFVLFPEGFVLREIVVNACQQLGFEPKVSFEGEDINAVKGLVSAGLGITLIPEANLIDSLPRTTVKLPLNDPKVSRTVGVIIPRERQLLPTEELFYRFLQDFFAKLGGFNQ